MKIKKFEARTEQDAINKVKQELGLNALILNIKRTQPKGIFAFFRKPVVEVTAAFDDKPVKDESAQPSGNTSPAAMLTGSQSSSQPSPDKAVANEIIDKSEHVLNEKRINEQHEKIKQLENKLTSTEDLLERAVSQLNISMILGASSAARKYDSVMIQLFYNALVEQGVRPDIADKVLEDVNAIDETEKVNINLVVKIVYNTLIKILGEPAALDVPRTKEESPKCVVFIGPTGVGKTTTIAKLSSLLILNENVRVGLITADTYRMAAVEQLKTYAEILGIDVGVVYEPSEITTYINAMKYVSDEILIDTAGRSHKNNGTLSELGTLLSEVPDSQRFLVLSVSTKFEDLLDIVNVYSEITDFNIIFTKTDETNCLGSILNICYLTGKRLSYLTNGQNVPDDIELVRPDKIAKALLGLGGN